MCQKKKHYYIENTVANNACLLPALSWSPPLHLFAIPPLKATGVIV